MYTYPKSYKNKSIKDQWKLLQKIFPILKDKHLPDTEPVSTEGTFVIPNYNLFGSYNDAVATVMKALTSTRFTYDWRSGNWGPSYLQQTARKETMWNSQGDVMVLGAQFGQKYAGKSVKSVTASYETNEVGFGIYEVLIMLLTHPERLQSYNDLWIDCPGDEYSPGGNGVFSYAPRLRFRDGQVGFGAGVLSSANRYYGSASGFVPQPLATGTLDTSESLTLDRAIQTVKEAGYKIIREM